jgi:hypothetical protein
LNLRYRLADTLAGSLAKPAEAIDVYRAVLEEEPFETRALDALERLYEQTSRWDELSALLEQRLERADTSAQINPQQRSTSAEPHQRHPGCGPD